MIAVSIIYQLNCGVIECPDASFFKPEMAQPFKFTMGHQAYRDYGNSSESMGFSRVFLWDGD